MDSEENFFFKSFFMLAKLCYLKKEGFHMSGDTLSMDLTESTIATLKVENCFVIFFFD